MNNEFDSKEELYFSWYMEVLKSKGYIEQYGKIEDGYNLTEGLKREYLKPMKKASPKLMEQVILNPSRYTPDFKILWNIKALGIFVSEINGGTNNKITTPFICQDLYSSIEVKANFDANNMSRLVINNIKFLYEKHKVFVNLIKVPAIFDKTFTPDRYFMTDETFKPRKLNYKNVRNIREFIQSIQK